MTHSSILSPGAVAARATIAALASIAALALAACGDRADYTEAQLFWEQPDTVIVGLGRVSDVKAQSRDRVWVADRMAATIFGIAPPESSYVSIGAADRPPLEIEFPAKLAVATDIGLAAFDAQTLRVDLFTFSGEFIRGFEPGFVPAVMSFSREPVGLTFAIAAEDSVGGRFPVVIRTDLRGESRDTLLSPSHGPEALRDAPTAAGETSMNPSATGMWVWTKGSPNEAWNLAPRGNRVMGIRDADASAEGVLADREREMLWLVHGDSTGTKYSAYDTRQTIAEDEMGDEALPVPYLGTRTTPLNFAPWTIHDGIAIGLRQVRGAPFLTAYDLNADRLQRTGDGE